MSLRLCQIQRTLSIVDPPRNVSTGGKEDMGHLEVVVFCGSLKRGPPPVLRGVYVCSSFNSAWTVSVDPLAAALWSGCTMEGFFAATLASAPC